ncbi:retrovirus-related pol polyprotein from transposon TNT 1-94 [Tanacetum coccineum]
MSSSKEVLFTKSENSYSKIAPEITSDTESDCDNQEPLPPVPKLSGTEHNGTSNDVIPLANLTQTSTVSDKTIQVSAKESSVKAIKKKAQIKSTSDPDPSPNKKADSSTEQLLHTLMEEVKGLKEQIKPSFDNSASVSQTGSSKSIKGKQHTRFGPCKHCGFKNASQRTNTLSKLKAQSPKASYSRTAPKIPKPFIPCKYYGFNDHHSDEYEYYPGCDICGNIAHEPADCDKRTIPNYMKPRIANQRSNEPTKKWVHKETNMFQMSVHDYLKRSVWYLDSGCSRHMTGVKQYLHKYSKELGPKVVFGDNSSGVTKGYGLVNCNGITFTRVSFVNGLKHNLISISQLCGANFKVLFTKTEGTIFNQNNEVMLIALRKRDVYVIDIKMENLNDVKVKELRSDNGTEDHLGKFDKKADDAFFLRYYVVDKAFRIFNIKRQEMEWTYHVTFNEVDEVITQTSIKGDEINFNVNKSFPNDEFLVPRNPSQSTRNDDYPLYVPAFDPLSTNNIIIPGLLLSFHTYTSQKQLHPTSCLGIPTRTQDIKQHTLEIHRTVAGLTTRSRVRDSEAASTHECLYVNFLSVIETKKVIEALEEEGWASPSSSKRIYSQLYLDNLRIVSGGVKSSCDGYPYVNLPREAPTPENTPLTNHASTSANPDPAISPTFVEVNYEVLESLLRERRWQIRNEDLYTKLEYYSEEYDEEIEMEPMPTRVRETTPVLQDPLVPKDKGEGL